jgi:hypothetical protein
MSNVGYPLRNSLNHKEHSYIDFHRNLDRGECAPLSTSTLAQDPGGVNRTYLGSHSRRHSIKDHHYNDYCNPSKEDFFIKSSELHDSHLWNPSMTAGHFDEFCRTKTRDRSAESHGSETASMLEKVKEAQLIIQARNLYIWEMVVKYCILYMLAEWNN